MNKTSYIFEQSEQLYFWGLVISSPIGLFGLYHFITQFKNRYFINTKGENVDKRILGIAGIFLSVIGFYSTVTQTSFYRDIKKNLAETTGTTIRKYYGGKGSPSLVEYTYSVDGRQFKESCGYTYKGEEIQSIIVPNGYYQVLYDNKQPENSVMNFMVKR